MALEVEIDNKYLPTMLELDYEGKFCLIQGSEAYCTMTESTTIQGICNSIDANPNDRSLLGILADAFEDIGDKRADGIRWVIENGFKPTKYDLTKGIIWSWWEVKSKLKEYNDALGDEYFVRLKMHNSADISVSREYQSPSLAYLDAAQAYTDLHSTTFTVPNS